ncbi:MAG TPA: TauD/TfdA family dioxygenase, partial [Jatrophihabitantaceae bacterium]
MSTHMVYAQRGATQVTCADGRRMTFEPLGASFGATVHGVDLSREVSDAEVAELRRAFNIYGALRFPDQRLEPADEVRTMRLFGGIADPAHGSNYNHVPGYPSLIILSNILGDDNQPIGSASKGGMEWHTDGSGWRRPPIASCLYAVEVPSTGGETYFANGYLAYESLPEAERDRLSTMKAHYSWPTLRKWLDEAVGRPPQEF